MKRFPPVALLALLAAAPVAAQEAPFPLDTLNVEVVSRAAPALAASGRSVQVITADQIRRAPGRTVADVLAWATGVDLQARSPAQADVALRGTSAEQVLVMVDGARVSDPQTAHFALDLTPPLDRVERIEILRGPASALYGADAVGGVINVVTRSHGGPAASASLEGGSFGTVGGALRGGGAVGGVDVRAGGQLRRSDGFRPGTDYRTVQAQATATSPVGGRELRVSAGYADRDFGARAFYTPAAAPFDEHEHTKTATLSAALAAPQGAAFSLEPTVSVRRHDDDFILLKDNPDFYHNTHRSWQAGGDLVARGAAAGARFAAGVEGYAQLLRSNQLGDRDESRAAGFGELDLGRTGAATLSAGLRGDWHSKYGWFVAPSLSGALWLAPGWRVRASGARAFRAPTWTDRYYVDPSNVGNPDLAPERSWEAEVGTDVSAGPGHLGVSAFVRRVDDLIDWVRPLGAGTDVPWRVENLGRATFHGVEAEAGAQALGGTWTLSATATSFSADPHPGLRSKYALRPLRHTVTLEGSHPLVAGLEVSARARTARREGDPAYFTADARLQERWSGGRVYLDLKNLTDADYLDVSGLPVAGRSAFIGVELSR